MSVDDAGRLVATVLGLEAQRVLAGAAVGRVDGATPADVEAIDADIDTVMTGLQRRGVAYPGHVLAARYELSGAEYLLLQIALMPFHAPDAAIRLGEILGGPDGCPRLTYAVKLLNPSAEDLTAMRALVSSTPLFAEQLVLFDDLGDGDAQLLPGLAVLELFGLG